MLDEERQRENRREKDHGPLEDRGGKLRKRTTEEKSQYRKQKKD